MKKIILTLAMMALAGAAQAQEYQSMRTTFGPGYRYTTYEDGSTETKTWNIDPVTGNFINIEYIRTHPIPAPTPFVDTDIHVDLSKFKKEAAVQAAKERSARHVSTPIVITGPTVDTTESDRKAAIERAKVDAAQHIKNVKAARAFKNGE